MSSTDAAASGTSRMSAAAPARQNRFIIKITAIATLGGLLFGYDTGVISGALLYMKDDLGLTDLGQATVVSSLLFGAMFGAVFGGVVSDRLGRRGSLLICSVLFALGALGTAVAPNVQLMVLARIILGLAVGCASATCPVYLSELAPTHRRGRIVTINELMIVTGAMAAYIVNAVIASLGGADVWRFMLGIGVIPALALFAGMLTLPDTPRWYVMRGRHDEARRVLEQSREPGEAEAEYNAIVEHANVSKAVGRKIAWQKLRSTPWMRRILWVGVGLAISLQATGINTAIYYAPTILESTGLGADASVVATIAVGVIGVVATVLGIWLLGRQNRRPLLMTGFAGVAASQLLLALAFLMPESTLRSYAILALIVLFVAFVQCYIGIGVWLLLSEIFPLAIRGVAVGISVFVLWGINTAISFVFPLLVASAGATITFGLFVVINVASLIFVAKAVPETRGRSLEELEEYLERNGSRVVRGDATTVVTGS